MGKKNIKNMKLLNNYEHLGIHGCVCSNPCRTLLPRYIPACNIAKVYSHILLLYLGKVSVETCINNRMLAELSKIYCDNEWAVYS